MTGTVKQNADNAQAASQMAVSAKEEAEKGGSVVLEAVEAMQAITTSSKRIAEISAASSEQAQGIEQVNKAITQMDSVTQQTAAQNEGFKSFGGALKRQAEDLSAQVAAFKSMQEAAADSQSSQEAVSDAGTDAVARGTFDTSHSRSSHITQRWLASGPRSREWTN